MATNGLNIFRQAPTLAWLAGLAFAGGALLGSYGSGGSDTALAVNAAATPSAVPSPTSTPTPPPSIASAASAKPATGTPAPPKARPLTPPSARPSPGVATQGRIASLIKLQSTKVGVVVADERGHTAYRYDRDDQQPPRSQCYGRCARTWLPLLVDDKTLAAANLDISKFGAVKRTDGAQQLTYKGWPLYLYKGDRYAGSLKGNDGAYGTWHAAIR